MTHPRYTIPRGPYTEMVCPGCEGTTWRVLHAVERRKLYECVACGDRHPTPYLLEWRAETPGPRLIE